MEYSFNSKSEGGVIRDLTLEYIQPILSQKEMKIKKFKPCDKYWLVIREGNYFAGSFSKLKIEIPIDTTFDKVFLIRTFIDELIELK
jgi:hypothetical protein